MFHFVDSSISPNHSFSFSKNSYYIYKETEAEEVEGIDEVSNDDERVE